jgi:polyferredoxin
VTNAAENPTAPSTTASAPSAAPPPWVNRHRHLPKVRWAVQLAYVAFLALVCSQFVRFVAQALGDGPITATRPPAVEAFLPIAALLGLKRFLLTGIWDGVHPAGLTLLAAAIVTAFVARKAFCSWVCPVGTLSRGLEWLGRKTLWRRRWPSVPRFVDLPLSTLKYLLFGFFAWSVVGMPLAGLEQFLRAPYNAAADAKMLFFFASPSSGALLVIGTLVLLSLFVKHAWCRWLCPYGGLLGLSSFLSPLSVRRDAERCSDCRACTRACPAEIQVHARLRVVSPECTGCLSCVAACRTKDALALARVGPKVVPAWIRPGVALGVMLGFWAVARATGFWESSLSPAAFRLAYRIMGL